MSRPRLPPLESFVGGLEEIWREKRLTNGGPILGRFERQVAALLGTGQVCLFTNGALALQLGLQSLKLRGEVITSPFSFAATANAILQCGLVPVFADVEPDHLTIDPARVEASITPRTAAILAVHVFGVPCDTAGLQDVATRRGLPLIYDAAHAFGTLVEGRSVAAYGDMSMFSFHATKLFHTGEGGALAFRNPALRGVLTALSNHGLAQDGDVPQAGTNAKMTEMQALLGELLLPGLPTAIAHASEIEAAYRDGLSEVPGISFLASARPGVSPNHAFMPMFVDPDRFGMSAVALQATLEQGNVFSRRYFYPLLSDMTAFASYRSADPLQCARRASQRILALPTYADLPIDYVLRICGMIRAIQGTLTRSPPVCAGASVGPMLRKRRRETASGNRP